jgi:hypothetical protein
MKKVLIITDERTGGTSFHRICGSIVGGLYLDDINTHFDEFKNSRECWACDYDKENKIGIGNYFSKYDKFKDVDIYLMIFFLFENGINVFKLSINDNFWTKEQTNSLIKSLNENVHNFIIIKLLRQNNFSKILSKCIAIELYSKIGNQAYDIKNDKHQITIDEKMFKEVCSIKMNTHNIIQQIVVPKNNIFTYETFYSSQIEVIKLRCLLEQGDIIDKNLFLENYYKDYKSENVTVSNLSLLERLFNDEFYH